MLHNVKAAVQFALVSDFNNIFSRSQFPHFSSL